MQKLKKNLKIENEELQKKIAGKIAGIMQSLKKSRNEIVHNKIDKNKLDIINDLLDIYYSQDPVYFTVNITSSNNGRKWTSFLYVYNTKLFKKIITKNLPLENIKISFHRISGKFDITKENQISKFILESSNFEHITLENFDRGYFSPETNDYLNQMEKEGKLTLINCTWSGLPVLRENLEVEEIGKKIWEKKIILDEKNKPLKTLLHKHLAFFSDFVELTEGKKVQIRITSEIQIILVEIFSFNGATSELIERKYYEFIDYSLSDEKDTSKINFSEKIDIITKFKNEGTIGFAKGMFFGEKQRIEEVQKEKFEWQQLAKDLVKKLPDYKPNQQISITNSMSNYNLNNSANNNSGNINLGENNQIIDNKINHILANNQDLEMRKVLFEIRELKNQILQNSQIKEIDKEDSLESVNEIVQNIEEKDKPESRKIIRQAFKKLSPIASNLTLGIVTNLAWEMLKAYFGIKF